MMKLPLTAALVACAVSARAQMRAAPSPAALAWAAPLAAYGAALGSAGIEGLETTCLPRLLLPGADGRAPMLGDAALLNPLALTLEESGVDPARFPELPAEFQATILRTAAGLTEDRLSKAVWNAVLDTNKGIGRSRFDDMARQARLSRETSLYLNDRTLEGLDILERRVADFNAARAAAAKAFLEDLPGKLAAGAFDGKTLLVREEDAGRFVWTTVDGDPARAYLTPQDALEARIAALDEAAPGPATRDDADLLLAALDHAIESGLIDYSLWTLSARERLHGIRARAKAVVAPAWLNRAAERIAAGRPRTNDILAVEARYRAAYAATPRDPRLRARLLAFIHTGGDGLPSWRDLDAARRELLERTKTSLPGAFSAAFAGTALAAIFGHWLMTSLSGYAAAAAFALGSLALTLRALRLAERVNALTPGAPDELDRDMARRFSGRPKV